MAVTDKQSPKLETNLQTDSELLGVLDYCNPESMFTKKNNNAPIALNIHFPKNLPNNYPQLVAREMSMYSHRFGKRNTIKTWLRGSPLHQLKSGEITEIAFLAANHFRMTKTPYSEYGFECSVTDLNETNLSLMKGLGFTTLLLNINTCKLPQNDEIAIALERLLEYKYCDIHFRLHNECCSRSTLYHWLAYLVKTQPAFIEIADVTKGLHSTHKLDEMAELMAKQADYLLLGDRFFVAKEHSLVKLKHCGQLQYTPPWGVSHNNIEDWVGLGIGAVGRINHTFYKNLTKESDYNQQITLGKLPICCSGQHLNKDAQRAWVIIEQLICFHKVSLHELSLSKKLSLSKEYLEKVKQVLAHASTKGWMAHQGTVFFLKNKGLNHLREICLSLQQC